MTVDEINSLPSSSTEQMGQTRKVAQKLFKIRWVAAERDDDRLILVGTLGLYYHANQRNHYFAPREGG